MDIGFSVNDNCLTEYQSMQMDKKHRYIIYSTAGNKIFQIEKIGGRDETFKDFVNSLPENDSRFCVFDYHITYPDGRKADKIIYIFWCPDTAPVKVKMVSASTNKFFQNKIQGFAVAYQCNDYSSLETSEIEKKLR